jgi:hypothetical protein
MVQGHYVIKVTVKYGPNRHYPTCMQMGITLGQYEAKSNLPRLTALFHARFGSETKGEWRVLADH